MFEQTVRESIIKELDKTQALIEKCQEDIKNSSSDVNKEIVENLNDLNLRKEKLLDDLSIIKDFNTNSFNQLKITIEAFIREAKTQIDNAILAYKIESNDKKWINGLLKEKGYAPSDFKITINITSLESREGNVLAERKIHIKSIKSAKEKKYLSSCEKSNIWENDFQRDLESDYFNLSPF